MNSDKQAALREATLRLRQQRNHHPCKTHGRIRAVCEDCLRVVCRKCGHKCTAVKVKPKIPRRRIVDKAKSLVTPELQPVWKELERLGALYVDQHEDSGHWMAVFPTNHLGVVTAGEMADKLWMDKSLRTLAEPTAYRAGRIKSGWWISFRLKG